MKRTGFARLAFALLGLCVGAAVAAPPTPILWMVSKGEGTVYLLGSMHVLEKGDYPLSRDVEGAYAAADKLVFEIAPDEMTSPATLAITMTRGMQSDPSHTLQDDLTPETWKKVVAYGANNGLPEAVVQKFQPWMMALSMVALESQKMGMDPNQGLDMHFMKMASADHKPTAGLETAEQQLAVFYTAPLKEQVEFLTQTLDEVADFKREIEEEHATWRRGDTATMAADAKKEFAQYQDLYDKLVLQRNRNWVPKIERMLAERGHVTLVIVGSLHLAGNDGVVHMLEQDGYRMQRICTGCGDVH